MTPYWFQVLLDTAVGGKKKKKVYEYSAAGGNEIKTFRVRVRF